MMNQLWVSPVCCFSGAHQHLARICFSWHNSAGVKKKKKVDLLFYLLLKKTLLVTMSQFWASRGTVKLMFIPAAVHG